MPERTQTGCAERPGISPTTAPPGWASGGNWARKIIYPLAFAVILPLAMIRFLPDCNADLATFLLWQSLFLPLAVAIRNGITAVHHPPDEGLRGRVDGATKAVVFLELALTGYLYIWPAPSIVGTWSIVILSAVAMLLTASANNFRKALPCEIGERLRPVLQNVTLLTASLCLAFIGTELFLTHVSLPESAVISKEWRMRRVDVEGSVLSYYWHGKLHVHDDSTFRRTSRFPPKSPGTFRILAIGDSLTYGYGIAAEDTYPRLLERNLSEKYRVEVLNLGVSGAQSEDVVRTLRKFTDRLNPDLVVYGACLNDFLPSGKGEYHNRQYAVPLPSFFKDRIQTVTETGRFLSDRYDRLLLKLRLRDDFFDDILIGFGAYDVRFRRDMGEMNRYVRRRCGAPVVAMVLDQFPEYGGRGYRISKIAEESFRAAGMNFIPMDGYYSTYDGKNMAVSQWEGHPNEEANRIFAAYLAERILQERRLDAFRK